MIKKYITHVRNLKQALNHGLELKKIHRVIQFNQNAWLKPHIDMNIELTKTAKNYFEKDFYIDEQCSFSKSYEKYEKT